MKLIWNGHSCFTLVNAQGYKLVTDPYHSYVGYSMPKVSADVVTISHHHQDHDYLPAVSGNYTVKDDTARTDVCGFVISGYACWHDEEKGALRGENTVYKIYADNLTVAHMGDIGEQPTEGLLAFLKDVDVLLLPIGGVFTVNARGAKAIADAVNPSYCVPMHYKTPTAAFGIDKLDSFTKLFNPSKIRTVADNEFQFDALPKTEDGYVILICKNY